MKKVLFLITIIILSSFLIKIKAQTTPTTTLSPTSSEKIQGIRDKVEEKVQEEISKMITENQKKSWTGTISSINKTSFTLKSDSKERTIGLSEEVKIINQKRQEITFQDLKQDQYILAMGYEKIDNTLSAGRIVVTDPYQENNKESIHGTIVNKANGEKIILVQNSNQEYELILDNNTGLNQKTSKDEIQDIEYEDLNTDQKVIAVIKPANGETNSYNALEILVTTIKQSPSPTEAE